MLKHRVITALVLVPIVVCVVLLLPSTAFAVLFGLIALQGSWEWGNFLRLEKPALKGAYSVLVLVAMYFCWTLFNRHSEMVLYILFASVVWWLVSLTLVLLFPKYQRLRENRLFTGIAGFLVIIPCWLALLALHSSSGQGPALVLYMLTLIWIADSCAYFGGKKWGRNKLSPLVSPGKSWEGVATGLAGVVIYAFLLGGYFQFGTDTLNTLGEFVGIGLLVAIFSVLGDLNESMFKRQAGIKDSGNLLPGHGGVLDRIDSITAAAPVFVVCLWLFLGVDILGLVDGDPG